MQHGEPKGGGNLNSKTPTTTHVQQIVDNQGTLQVDKVRLSSGVNNRQNPRHNDGVDQR